MRYIKNRYVIFALCLIVSGVIAFVIVPKRNNSAQELTEVVRVTQRIEKNTVITEDMLKTEQIPKQGVPETIIADKSDIVGKISAVTLLPEDNLVPDKFSDTLSLTDTELYDMDNTERLAISVSVNTLASSVSGKLLPGDVVSVYGFVNETKMLAEYADLRYLEVLAVTNSSAEDLSSRKYDSEKDSSDKVIPATVTLSVNQNQAEELVVLENTSSLHIVFVGRGNLSRKLLQN